MIKKKGVIHDMEKLVKSKSILEDKEFYWNFRVESGLILEKEVEDYKQLYKFTTKEIEEIIIFISRNKNIPIGIKEKLEIKINSESLGEYIFNSMRRKITEAAASVELISILKEAEIIEVSVEDGEIFLEVDEENWEKDWKGKVRQLYINKIL